MGKWEMLDTFGVPEFYADQIGAIEDIGSGMIRVVKCVKRQGALVPVYSFIAPAMSFLHDGEQMRAFAERMLRVDLHTH